MSNREVAPEETVCRSGVGETVRTDGSDGSDVVGGIEPVELLEPRDVPLGGPRAMDVRRTLPQRRRSLIGAWCFLDSYGPDRVADSGGMQVPRHPHTGLQTVSWLFEGEVEHRDSAGHHAIVRPGELGIMTAGRGISHSEFSTAGTRVLHGAQLWVALPDATRNTAPGFAHHRPEPVHGVGWEALVFLGDLLGSRSPVRTHTPLVGAELRLEPGARLSLDLDPAFEHGVLLDTGELAVDGRPVPADHLAHLPQGRSGVVLHAGAGGARALVIGGAPLGERVVMWWNFVGRSHEEIAAYRAQWMAEIGAGPVDDAGADHGAGPLRFGTFPPGEPAPLPAPELPGTRMVPRG